MFLTRFRESILSKSSKKSSISSSSCSNLDFEKELPKLNFNYKLNLDLYNMDVLINEFFTDLKTEGFIIKK